MPKSVKVDIASLPKDAEVELPGLGVFKNGATAEISDERLKEYENTYPELALPENLEFVSQPVDFDHTEPAPAAVALDQAVVDEDKILQQQMQIQEQRLEDPLATANIGIEVPAQEGEAK